MKVIDILNEVDNTPQSIITADELIRRIDSFLNPSDPNRVQVLNPESINSEFALTTNRLDADSTGQIQTAILKQQEILKTSKKNNDGTLPNKVKNYRKWLRDFEGRLTVEVTPTDVYNTNVRLIKQLLDSDEETMVPLISTRKAVVAKKYIKPEILERLRTYIKNGAALIQQKNDTNQYVINDQLARLNTEYITTAKNITDSVTKKLRVRKLEVPSAAVENPMIKEIEQLRVDIPKFLSLPDNSSERISPNIAYTRADVTADDKEWLEIFLSKLNQLDTSVTADIRDFSKNLKSSFTNFLARRQVTDNTTSAWHANRRGKGVLQQLGELPLNFDISNPLHTKWKALIDTAHIDKGRRMVSGLYTDYWKIVESQQWKCYLSNRPMDIENSQFLISIDRIDSTKDYSPSNVAFCCHAVNIMKGNLYNNELVALCKHIVQYNNLVGYRQITESTTTRFMYNGETTSPRNMTIQQFLIKKRDIIGNVIETYSQYLFSYEIRQLTEMYNVLDKEITNPTTLGYAELLKTEILLPTSEPNRLLDYKLIKRHAVDRSKQVSDPIKALLTGLQTPVRVSYMTYDDFRNDVKRIEKAQPELKEKLGKLLKNSYLFLRHAKLRGDQTINDKHAEKLETILKYKYQRYRSDYKKGIHARKYKPTISTDELITIAKQQHGRCAITGFKFSTEKKSPDGVSLDRIDSISAGGYGVKNIQLVLRRVNVMKSKLSMTDFLNWCLAVYDNADIEVTDEDLHAAISHSLEHDTDEDINDKD